MGEGEVKYLHLFDPIPSLGFRVQKLEFKRWSDDVWMTMVEKATVNRNKTITFQFTSGKEITL